MFGGRTLFESLYLTRANIGHSASTPQPRRSQGMPSPMNFPSTPGNDRKCYYFGYLQLADRFPKEAEDEASRTMQQVGAGIVLLYLCT